MTDTEKQAIDNFKFFNEGDYITKEMEESKDIVLNLIERQQAEIENLKNRKERQLKRFSKYKENIENKHEEIYEDLVQEIEKKDKIIDEMAKYIVGLDIEEDICTKTGRLRECDSMAYGECENCIKEYFKKKVEEK